MVACLVGVPAGRIGCPGCVSQRPRPTDFRRVRTSEGKTVGSVIKKRRKRMAKKKHRKLLKRTRVQRRRLGK